MEPLGSAGQRQPPDLDGVRSIVAAARVAGRTTLLEPEGRAVIGALGISVPPALFVEDPGEASTVDLDALGGERVVVKVVSPHLVHKSDVGGVAIVPRARRAVVSAIRDMESRLADAAIAGFLIVEYVEHERGLGDELLASIRWTPDFGPVVSLAGGGVDTEHLAADLRPGREVAIVSPSLTPPGRIADLISGATAVRLATTGMRGQAPRASVERLIEVIGRLAALGELMPDEILDCEVNPMAVTQAGLVALDVLVTLGDGERPVRHPRPLHKLRQLLAPRSVAIAGVSTRMNPGRIILRNLLRDGFDPRRIWIVKPGADAAGTDRIDGCDCVPDLASLPEKADLFVVAVSAAQAPEIVAEVIERDAADSLIVIPGGLGEKQGSEPLVARMRDALAAARASAGRGPLVNGGNCLGVRSRPGGIDTMFIPGTKLAPPGGPGAPLAIIGGSGAFVITRMDRLGALEPRYAISVGNQIDLTVGDYLTHLKDDPEIAVFAVYVEGFAPLDGVAFLAAAREISESGRTVILYRAGRTVAGVRASASHTAAIAGDMAVTRELARDAGVVLAESVAGFDDLTRAFTLLRERRPAGVRLGAVSNAGFECVAVADHLESLELARFEGTVAERLGAILRRAGIDAVVDVHNPLDLTPMADDAAYEQVVRTVLEAPTVDVALVGIVPLTPALETLPAGPGHDEDVTHREGIAGRMTRLWRETTKPWAVVVDGGPLYDPLARLLEEGGIPTFRTADAAVRALDAFCAARIRGFNPPPP